MPRLWLCKRRSDILTLFIDDREPAKVIAQIKQLVPDAEMRRMECGDYVIEDFAIERKTISDLMGSVFDERYWRQLANLKNTYPHTCVIVEGHPFNAMHNGSILKPAEIKLVDSVINSTVMKWSIPVVCTVDYLGTANKISDYYKMSEKKSSKPRAMVKKQLDPKLAQLSMLQVIDGVGAIAASRLLSSFTFRELVNVSDPSVLSKKVVGMNRKQSENIVKVFNCE